MGSRRWTVLGALALVACGGSDRTLEWEVVVPAELEGRVAFVETTIEDGTCSAPGTLRYRDEVMPGTIGAAPSTLAPGTYSFRAMAMGVDCTPLAERCETVGLPLADGERVSLELEAVTRPPGCDATACSAGRCLSADGGPTDGGGDVDSTIPRQCALGEATDAGCIVPSNVPEVALGALGEADLVVPVTSTWVFRTETGQIDAYDGTPVDLSAPPDRVIRPAASGVMNDIGFSAAAQLGADTRLGVFSVASLDVPAMSAIVGAGDFALVLLVGGDVLINGLVTVAAAPLGAVASAGDDWALMPGPGGAGGGTTCSEEGSAGAPGSGPGGGGYGGSAAGNDGQSGAGGGSFGGRGGDGGDADAVSGGMGGGTYGAASLSPLLGGSGGGPGGEADCGRGGAGGGALQITAGGRITVRGRIDASGAPGGGGRGGSDPGAGGAGGSGGGVLLEGPTLQVTGTVSANGGGGGAGGGGSLPDGRQAASGSHGDAGPGASGGAGTAAGGSGGAGSDSEGAGSAGTANRDGGGGGGGAGRIRFNADEGGEDLLGATLAPSGASRLATSGRIERR